MEKVSTTYTVGFNLKKMLHSLGMVSLRRGRHRFEMVKTKRQFFYQSGKDRKEDFRVAVCADKFTFQVIQVREQVFNIRTTSEEEDCERSYYFSSVGPVIPTPIAIFAFVFLVSRSSFSFRCNNIFVLLEKYFQVTRQYIFYELVSRFLLSFLFHGDLHFVKRLRYEYYNQ